MEKYGKKLQNVFYVKKWIRKLVKVYCKLCGLSCQFIPVGASDWCGDFVDNELGSKSCSEHHFGAGHDGSHQPHLHLHLWGKLLFAELASEWQCLTVWHYSLHFQCCASHSSIVLAICVPKIIKFDRNLMKFRQKQVGKFFGPLCVFACILPTF